ncbi:hypothetical protein G6031_09465 [Dietzia sp. CQ4]|uniref:hypothetical protein n=1 Tax=Dietzia sp. (strain CQ4) TaxID=370437 RepID=UPI0015F9C5DF|nr:hypothetical protein [Dietzia sp. CQ4]MBB1034615.1 hypothetical protein [Dietzia sp. CQ4]
MTTHTYSDRPLPAPLPYASQAGRGEVPAPPPHAPVNPDGPILRPDEFCLYVTLGVLAAFMVVMLAIAVHLNGGL